MGTLLHICATILDFGLTANEFPANLPQTDKMTKKSELPLTAQKRDGRIQAMYSSSSTEVNFYSKASGDTCQGKSAGR